MKRLLLETDEWLRRRIRMCIWKAWKKAKTKVANLIRCGINKYKAYEWGYTRKGYWRIADSYILHRAITNEYLCRAGYATLMGAYLEWHPKQEPPYAERHVRWCERSVNTKVGDKYLWLVFTSYSIVAVATKVLRQRKFLCLANHKLVIPNFSAHYVLGHKHCFLNRWCDFYVFTIVLSIFCFHFL